MSWGPGQKQAFVKSINRGWLKPGGWNHAIHSGRRQWQTPTQVWKASLKVQLPINKNSTQIHREIPCFSNIPVELNRYLTWDSKRESSNLTYASTRSTLSRKSNYKPNFWYSPWKKTSKQLLWQGGCLQHMSMQKQLTKHCMHWSITYSLVLKWIWGEKKSKLVAPSKLQHCVRKELSRVNLQ